MLRAWTRAEQIAGGAAILAALVLALSDTPTSAHQAGSGAATPVPAASQIGIVAPFPTGSAADATPKASTVQGMIQNIVHGEGGNPTPIPASVAVGRPGFDIISTTIDATQKKITLAYIAANGKQYSQSAAYTTWPFDATQVLLGPIHTLLAQAAAPSPAPSFVPNKKYDIVIVEDNAISGDTVQSNATTGFVGDSYFQSRLQVDLLAWQFNATDVTTYFKSLNATNAAIPTSFVETVKELCSIQPGLYILSYSLAYSETAQAFWGTQRGYANVDTKLFRCRGDWPTPATFGFSGPSPSPRPSADAYVASRGHHNYTVHRNLPTSTSKVWPQVTFLLGLAVNRVRAFSLAPWLGSGSLNLAFINGPGSNDSVTDAVGEDSRYISCATFLDIIEPLEAVSSADYRPAYDNRDLEPCPTARALFNAFSIEYPRRPPALANESDTALFNRLFPQRPAPYLNRTPVPATPSPAPSPANLSNIVGY